MNHLEYNDDVSTEVVQKLKKERGVDTSNMQWQVLAIRHAVAARAKYSTGPHPRVLAIRSAVAAETETPTEAPQRAVM